MSETVRGGRRARKDFAVDRRKDAFLRAIGRSASMCRVKHPAKVSLASECCHSEQLAGQ